MLAAPVEFISKKIIPLSRHYSVAQLNNILTMADHYMKADQPMLFKFSHDEDIADFFKTMILPQLTTILSLSDLKKLLEAILAASPIQYDLNNMNHVWAYLIKTCFKNCDFISSDVNEMLHWRFFIDDIKQIYTDYLPLLLAKNQQGSRYDFSGIDKEKIQNTFLQFMCRLYQSGNIPAARALHQLLYQARRVGQTPQSTMGLLELGTYIGPSLHFSLLRNLLASDEVNNVVHSECAYFAKITGSMLEHPFFNLPFEAADYPGLIASVFTRQLTADQHKEKMRAIFCSTEVLSFDDPIKKLEIELRQMSLNQIQDVPKARRDRKEKRTKKDNRAKTAQKDNTEKETRPKSVTISPLSSAYVPSFEHEKRGGRLTPRQRLTPRTTGDAEDSLIPPSAQQGAARPCK